MRLMDLFFLQPYLRKFEFRFNLRHSPCLMFGLLLLFFRSHRIEQAVEGFFVAGGRLILGELIRPLEPTGVL